LGLKDFVVVVVVRTKNISQTASTVCKVNIDITFPEEMDLPKQKKLPLLCQQSKMLRT